MNQVTLIEAEDGDWEAIYLDGKKVDENHSISFPDFLRTLQKAGILLFTRVEVEQVEVDFEGEKFWEYPEGAFPDDLPQDLTTLPGFTSLS